MKYRYQAIVQFFGLILILLLLSGCQEQKNSSGEKRNILFIAVDDLSDWAGFMGGHTGMDIFTPNIDRLAENAMIFTNAHTPAPACAPARTAIMTGVHHTRSGAENVYWWDGPKWREFDSLANALTMEQFFKQNGYKTLGAGKIYHAQAPPWQDVSQLEPEGWDFYYPSPYISHPYQIRAPKEVIYPDDVDNTTRPGGENGWWTWGPLQIPDEKMSDYHVMEYGRYQLRQKHEKPFFLAVGNWKPHDPWEVPQKYFDMYPLEDIVLPEVMDNDLADALNHGREWIHKWAVDNKQWEKIVQAYAASITFADAMVGRLLETFYDSEYAGNTILVLWSDHGMHMGEKENIEKFTLWEESTRVPLIISVPGLTEAGTVCDQPVSLMDLYPTLVDLAGLEKPDHLDGNSLLPQIIDPVTETSPVVTSYNFTWRDPEIVGHAVRSQRFRYIYYPDINLEELYDHNNDPNEWTNVAYKKENKSIIADHRKVLKEFLPNLEWKEESPEGYSVDDQGNVLKHTLISK